MGVEKWTLDFKVLASTDLFWMPLDCKYGAGWTNEQDSYQFSWIMDVLDNGVTKLDSS